MDRDYFREISIVNKTVAHSGEKGLKETTKRKGKY